MILSGDKKTMSWGCSKCRGPEFEEGDKHRKIRNCDAEDSVNIAWSWMPSLRRCPLSQVESDGWMMFGWWVEWVQFKVLPWGGSDLMEQPAFVLEVFKICESIKSEIEQRRADDQRREAEKMKRKAKGNSRGRR